MNELCFLGCCAAVFFVVTDVAAFLVFGALASKEQQEITLLAIRSHRLNPYNGTIMSSSGLGMVTSLPTVLSYYYCTLTHTRIPRWSKAHKAIAARFLELQREQAGRA